MISYCICVYRPRLFYILLDDLMRKTTVPYEILVWLNTRAPELEGYLDRMAYRGVPVKIIGTSPENVGMSGYKMLFHNAKYDLITQVHDDVVCVSRKIAEIAAAIFNSHENVKQLVADVVQDAFTTGGRPGDAAYTPFDLDSGLYSGPIDGWFSIYHRSILGLLLEAPYQPYFYLGSYVQMQLRARAQEGLLCRKMKVFHIAGPAYARLFETVESEVRKYTQLGDKSRAELYASLTPDGTVIKQMSGEYKKSVAVLEKFGK